MALSLPFPRRGSGDDNDNSTDTAASQAEITTLDDSTLKLDHLYTQAGDLEVELENASRRSGAALTAGQIGSFNELLKEARNLLPNSKALREDVEEIDAETRPIDAYHALHVTIVPTLHNALPDSLYRRH